MSNTDNSFRKEAERRLRTIKQVLDSVATQATLFHNILEKTKCVSNGVGHAEIARLRQALFYWAPERTEQFFWHGNGSVWGYLDILNNYFQDNKEVYAIYSDFMNTYYKSTIIEV